MHLHLSIYEAETYHGGQVFVFVRFCTCGCTDVCMHLCYWLQPLLICSFLNFFHMLSDIKRPSMDTVEGPLDYLKRVNEAAFFWGQGFLIHVRAPELSIAFFFHF